MGGGWKANKEIQQSWERNTLYTTIAGHARLRGRSDFPCASASVNDHALNIADHASLWRRICCCGQVSSLMGFDQEAASVYCACCSREMQSSVDKNGQRLYCWCGTVGTEIVLMKNN